MLTVNDFSIVITRTPSPNDKLGVRLIQTETVITRLTDNLEVSRVVEPNDTPERARLTAKKRVQDMINFDTINNSFVDGPQTDLFIVPEPPTSDALSVFKTAQITQKKIQDYVSSGLIAVDDPVVSSINDAVTIALDNAKAVVLLDAQNSVATVTAQVNPIVK